MSGSAATAAGAEPLLAIRRLDHAFGGVHAVQNVDLDLRGGEVCALLGENGAGKSTLMKAVAGAFRPDAGTVRLAGVPLPAGDPGAVRDRGVSLIYQETNLVGTLTVHENIALGREPRRGPLRLLVDAARSRADAARLLERLGAAIDPDLLVERLSVAEQQLVEIAKALSIDVRVLIMDEPTSALSGSEADRLFDIVRRIAAEGVAVAFITHRLEEVRALADRVVVMRDGAVVADEPAATMSEDAMIRTMVGRSLDRQFPERTVERGTAREPILEPILEVDGLSCGALVHDVSLVLRPGEVLALTGLVGSGCNAVGRALFGVERAGGTVRLGGRNVRDAAKSPKGGFRHPAEAIAAGVGWISDDRKGEGLVLDMSVLANLTLPHLERYARAGILDPASERAAAAQHIESLSIRTTGPAQPVWQLSGGNQQKVAFARWLVDDCRVLVCAEPTRGVDVGGRHEIYELLARLAAKGLGVLMISSDMQEVLGMADRIVVLHEGTVAGEVVAADATQERLLRLAMRRQ